MIGIYKITNKINGKAYIGQSNNIERRWKEHKKKIDTNGNPMYIDFQKYGLENFTFEVLEECSVSNLDNREIEYIAYYKTLAPNGYNLTIGGQGVITSRNTFNNYLKEENLHKVLSTKQNLVYSYLLSISKINNNGLHYVYKNSFLVKDACELLGISQPTWRNALKKLEEEFYITIKEKYYIIDIPNSFAPLNINLICYLIKFGNEIKHGGNIVSVYSVLWKYWKHCQINKEECHISINQLKQLFITGRHKEELETYILMLGVFEVSGLIILKKGTKKFKGMPYTDYEILNVKTNLEQNIRNYGSNDISSIIEALNNENLLVNEES